MDLEIFSDHLSQRKRMFLSEVVYLIAGIQIQLMDTSLQPLQHSSAHKASLSQGLAFLCQFFVGEGGEKSKGGAAVLGPGIDNICPEVCDGVRVVQLHYKS